MSETTKLLELIDTYASNSAVPVDDEIASELSGIPLLAGVSVHAVVYLRGVITAVLSDDMQAALDEIFRLSDDDIPDLYAEAYLMLASNICAACEYADGWVMFQKELVRLYSDTGRGVEANTILKQLEELLPDDMELPDLRVQVNTNLRQQRTKALIEIRKQEQVDSGFVNLTRIIAPLSEENIYKLVLDSFNMLPSIDKRAVTDYFTTFSFWGTMDLENAVFDALHERARVLHSYLNDFIWLYDRLADARSKNVLYAILSSWVGFDSMTILKYTEKELAEYFHPDIFPFRNDEVFVDVGAYVGDSVASFIDTYGFTYKCIYCYEIAPETVKILEKNLADVPNIYIRNKAAGAAPGIMYIDFGNLMSSERVADKGETAVEVVCLDDDITEPVTFIKMDIEGAEKDALRGCARHIRESHPKLAICTYHGYDDLYAIPRLIEDIEPGYKFYMRHHGGNLIPTEYSLLAVWEDDV